jgi:hypothetical protein
VIGEGSSVGNLAGSDSRGEEREDLFETNGFLFLKIRLPVGTKLIPA